MKNLLILLSMLALSPLAARAQYGVGGNESLQTHSAHAHAEVEAQKNNGSSGSYSGRSARQSGPMPFFTPKATRMANKRKREHKRNNKEQSRINAELQKQREDVLK